MKNKYLIFDCKCHKVQSYNKRGWGVSGKYFSYFSTKRYVAGTH